MANNRRQKSKNALNIFLNEYFRAIIAASLLLFLALAYFIVLEPKFAATQDAIRANLDSERGLYLSSLKKKASYQAINAVYQKINPSDMQRFNGVLPDDYVPERLFGEIEEMVTQGGWLVKEFKIIPPEDNTNKAAGAANAFGTATTTPSDPRLGQYHLQLTVAAIDYPGFKNLLRIFENNLRLFDITRVNFSPSSATAQLDLSTYYYQALR